MFHFVKRAYVNKVCMRFCIAHLRRGKSLFETGICVGMPPRAASCSCARLARIESVSCLRTVSYSFRTIIAAVGKSRQVATLFQRPVNPCLNASDEETKTKPTESGPFSGRYSGSSSSH